MGVNDKRRFNHDRQVFVSENARFIQLLEKTKNGGISVTKAITELRIKQSEWYSLKKQYNMFNGLND